MNAERRKECRRLVAEKKLSRSAALAFTFLLDAADATAECWPSLETIGTAIGASPRSVSYYLRALIDVGLVVTRRVGKWGRRFIEIVGGVQAEQSAPDRRTDELVQAETRAPEPPLNPGRETGSADRQAEHRRPVAGRWRNAERPRQEAPASRPAPADTFVPRDAAIFPALVAKLSAFTNRRIDPHALGLNFAPAWIEAARAALATG